MTENEKQIVKMAMVIRGIQYLGGLEMKIARGLFEKGYRLHDQHGRWQAERTIVRCSHCGTGFRDSNRVLSAREYDYCPKCGAIMDERKGRL